MPPPAGVHTPVIPINTPSFLGSTYTFCPAPSLNILPIISRFYTCLPNTSPLRAGSAALTSEFGGGSQPTPPLILSASMVPYPYNSPYLRGRVSSFKGGFPSHKTISPWLMYYVFNVPHFQHRCGRRQGHRPQPRACPGQLRALPMHILLS